MDHRADHRHHDRRGRAVAGDIGDEDADAIAAERQHIVVIAAGVAAGLVEAAEADRRVRRHLRRQQQSLHLRCSRELLVEAIAAASHLALEVLSRQMHGDARQHFFALDRLGDVVDRADLETRYLVRHFAARRQEDHQRVARLRIRLQLEQHQVRLRSLRDVERGRSVFGGEDAMAAQLQRAREHLEIGGAVVDDEDRRRRRCEYVSHGGREFPRS